MNYATPLKAVDDFTVTVDAKITEFSTTVTKDLSVGLSGLDAKLAKNLKALRDDLQCSYNGVVTDKNLCQCKSGFTGFMCEDKILNNCKELHGGKVGFHSAVMKDGSNGLCYRVASGEAAWTMVLNLATAKAPAQTWKVNWWRESKASTTWTKKPTMIEDGKSQAFYDKKDQTSVMMVIHDQGNLIGSAEYDVHSNSKGKTMSQLFKGGNNQRW
jgi:hypothetical protein